MEKQLNATTPTYLIRATAVFLLNLIAAVLGPAMAEFPIVR